MQNDNNQNPQLQQVKLNEKKKRGFGVWIFLGLILFFGYFAMQEAVNPKYRDNESRVETPQDEYANVYEKVLENTEGEYKYFNIWLMDKSKVTEVNDRIFNYWKDKSKKIFIRYFDNRSTATTYFEKKERQQELSLDSYIFNFVWDKEDGGRLDQNVDGKGKWVTIKKY